VLGDRAIIQAGILAGRLQDGGMYFDFGPGQQVIDQVPPDKPTRAGNQYSHDILPLIEGVPPWDQARGRL